MKAIPVVERLGSDIFRGPLVNYLLTGRDVRESAFALLQGGFGHFRGLLWVFGPRYTVEKPVPLPYNFSSLGQVFAEELDTNQIARCDG